MTAPTPPHPVLGRYYSSAAHRESFVGDLFDRAARHYNQVGRMLDFGSGARYRRKALRRAGLRPGMRLLDVATGTGLVAQGAVRVVGESGSVIGVDPSRGMLREAQHTVPGSLVQGRAEALPFRDGVFDMLSMGFALRHVADLDVTFREYWRVLKPGGRLVLLEVSRPASAVSRHLLRVHLQRVLPALVRIARMSRSVEVLVKYYWDTIDRCVPPETILKVLRHDGFADVGRRTVFGFVSEYVALKPRC